MATRKNGANGAEDGTTKAPEQNNGERKLARVRVHLAGLRALKPQAMTEEKILDIKRKFKEEEMPKGLSREEARAWLIEHIAKPCLYTLNGIHGVPGRNLFQSLIEGGRYVRANGLANFTGGAGSLVSSYVTVEEEFLPFPEQCQDWKFDLDHGWGSSGTFVAIPRPRFDAWAIRPTLILDVSEFPMSKFRSLIDQTGIKVGLCGHRPATKGPFGTFAVVDWEVLSDDLQTTGNAALRERAKAYTYPQVG